jgi:hypothetical protein
LAALARIERKVDANSRLTAGSSLRTFDAYSNMTQTSAGQNKPNQEAIRNKYFDFCGITKDANDLAKTRACCVLTGRNGEGRKVLKLAHLVPASSSSNILNTLRLPNDENGVWSLRNVLLLCEKIEHYFDRKKLSFVPSPLYNNVYILKIWDEEIRNELLYDGATDIDDPGDSTIGYYENRCLNLTMPNGNVLSPFKRCLSYQVFMSFASSKLKKCDVPADFASDIGKDWNNLRNDLLITRSSLETAIAEETDEGEHDFDNRSDT